MESSASRPVHDSFNFTDSDVTLCSADGTLFRVHKANLSAHSITFKDSFHVGSPTEEPVPLGENAATVAVVLAMCYPSSDPPIDLDALGIHQLLDVYEACSKYQMWVLAQLSRRVLRPIAHTVPFRSALTARIVGDEDLLSLAVEATLHHDILDEHKQYRQQCGALWTSLVEYHLSYRREVIRALDDLTSTPRDDPHTSACSCLCYTRELQWRSNLLELANASLPAWPFKKLEAEIQRCLGQSAVKSCSGCVRSWQDLRKTVLEFKPTCVFRA